MTGQPIAGGFNDVSWGEKSADWICQHGLLLLSNPGRTTYHSGNFLGKVIYLPGDVIPPSSVATEREMDGHEDAGDGADIFYPAITYSRIGLDNHHPAGPELPSGGEPFRKAARTIKKKTGA